MEAQSGYNCVSNTCSAVFENPQYLTLEDCQSDCEAPSGYDCVFEYDWQKNSCEWEWFAWENGMSIGKDPETDNPLYLTRDKEQFTIWEKEGKNSLLIDDPLQQVLPTAKRAAFINSVSYHAISVTSNKTVQEAVRGFGQAPTNYAIETAMDRVASFLKMDRLALRQRNLIRSDQFPYLIPSGSTYDSGDYHALLEKALELADYDGFAARQAEARKENRYLGIGVSSCIEDTGMGPYEGVTVRVDPRGQVYVSSGAASQGQGHKTILRQIVADELSVDIEKIHVEIGDTGKFPQGVGTVGSRVGVNIGTAAYSAATEVKTKALALAAEVLEADLNNLEIEDGIIRDRGRSNITISLGEIALKLAPMAGAAIPEGHTASLEATSFDASKGPPHASGSNVCEVEVDLGTGEVKLLNYSVAHDCGRKINPLIVEGQIIGGVVHGIGNALFEEMIYDENGQPQNTNYGEYLLPIATEMPQINIVHQETPSPLNPLGLKGAGEGGTIPAANAVIAAIENALEDFGVVVDKYPIHPERLCELIDQGRMSEAAE